MYAVDDLSDAIDVTREFLTPVAVGTWLRLVLVVFFVSGVGFGGGVPPVGDVGTIADGPTVEPVDEEAPAAGAPPFDVVEEELPVAVEDLVIVAVVLVVVGLLLWLLFAIVRAIMDFVFVDSLRSGEVHVRRYAREHLGRAIRLFVFRVVVSLLAFGPLAAAAAVVVLGANAFDEVVVASLALVGLLAIPIGLLYAVVMRFTTVFVVPIMLLEDRSVLGGWRRFWPTVAGNWAEYLVYLVLVWIVLVLVGIALSILAFFGSLLIGIPFGILAVALALFGPIGLALAAVVALVALLLFLVYVTVLQVPVYSYLRYYALLLLGDTNPELDLIPDRRAAVRVDAGEWDEDGAHPDAEDEGRDGADGDRREEGPDSRSAGTDDEWAGDGWDEEADDWDASNDRADDDRDDGW